MVFVLFLPLAMVMAVDPQGWDRWAREQVYHSKAAAQPQKEQHSKFSGVNLTSIASTNSQTNLIRPQQQDAQPVNEPVNAPRVFVYELPKIWNSEMKDSEGRLPREGFGPSAADELGEHFFDTDQFSADAIIHQRLLHSKYRTTNWHEANLFYIPYYLAFESSQPWTGIGDKHDGVAREMFLWLDTVYPTWTQQSSMHFLVSSRIALNIHQFLNLATERGIGSVLAIEAQKWEVAHFPMLQAIPYPTNLHLAGHQAAYPWQTAGQKDSMAVFIGSKRNVIIGFANELRAKLSDQCGASQQCHLMLLEGGNQAVKRDMVDNMRRSTFCIQPMGDSPTRRAIFDSLMVGCIPVVFDEESMNYPWFIPDPAAVSIILNPYTLVSNGTNLMQELAQVPHEKVQKMQANIAQIASGLQYATQDMDGDAIDILVNRLWHDCTQRQATKPKRAAPAPKPSKWMTAIIPE